MIFGTLIDPGHGGPDPGNEHGGLVEADFVFELSRRLVPHVLLGGKGAWDAALSRDQGEDPSIGERDSRGRQLRANWVLSVHSNAGVDADGVVHPDWHGAIVFHCDGNPRTAAVAQEIAAATPRELAGRGGGAKVVPVVPRDRYWPRVARVLYGYRLDAVLFEAGHQTNPRDAAYLRLLTSTDRLVATLLAGVAKAAQIYGVRP